MKPTLVVMAAGIGSRYGGLKQVDPIGPGGEIVIDYSVYDAIRAGFGKVVFIIRKEIEGPFREVVEPHFRGRIPFEYVHQELDMLPPGFKVPADRKKPWGTTHAILACRDKVREPFGVVNADDFYGRRSFELLSKALQKKDAGSADYVLIGFLIRNTLSEHGAVSRGVCEVSDAGRLVKVVERTKIERMDGRIQMIEDDGRWVDLAEEAVVSMNMWGFTPRVFGQFDGIFKAFLESDANNPKAECYIPTSVDALIHRGEASVEVASSPDTWLGMTYTEDKPWVIEGVRKLIRAGEYPERLWA
jgi:choline kinase